MGTRLTGLLVGAVFGVALSWTGMSSPEVIRGALLLEDPYLFLMFASAVATAFVGLRVLRALRTRALLTGDRVEWSVDKPQRRNVTGSLLFGVGWALSGACPGPVATQLGQGIAWSLFTIAGIAIGIVLHNRREAKPPLRAARAYPRSAPAGTRAAGPAAAAARRGA
jgi:uncharacterized membrane protein YedE/YeeE